MIITNGKQITVKDQKDREALDTYINEVFGLFSTQNTLDQPLEPGQFLEEPSETEAYYNVPRDMPLRFLLDNGAELAAIHPDDIIEKPGTLTTQYKYEYTSEELDSQADQMSEIIKDKHETAEEAKQIASTYKAKQTEFDAQLTKLSNQRMQGFEYRDCEATLRLNFRSGKREYYNKTTGKLVKEEELHSDDYKYRAFE